MGVTSQSCVYYLHAQADNNITCMVPEFVHSLAAYMCASPLLTSYRDLLLQNAQLQQLLSIGSCSQQPSQSFVRAVLEPLAQLKNAGQIAADMCVIVVDALNAAEFHKPDYGDTIATFLERHVALFPPWLKFVVTVDALYEDISKSLPFCRISLDPINRVNLVNLKSLDYSRNQHDVMLVDDINEYVMHRIRTSSSISENLALVNTTTSSSSSNARQWNLELQEKVMCFVQNQAKGCLLYVKLLLNLVESGSLALKSSNLQQVLPSTLGDVFLLLLSLKFPTVRSFERVAALLNVTLASLYPLTAHELYDTLNANAVLNALVRDDDFTQRMTSLREILWQRRDGTFVFFHPSFRDWLLRREDGEKFVCDLR